MSGTASHPFAALFRSALADIEQDKLGEAEAALETILAGAPLDAEALQLLGQVRRRQGRQEQAEELYRRALAIDPGLAHVHHNLGNLLRVRGRNADALPHFEEAIRLKPNYADAHVNRGIALTALDRLDEAEKSYRRALHIQPGSMAAVQGLGVLLNRRGKPKEAETLLSRALQQATAAKKPDARQIAGLQHALAMSLKAQQRPEEALALLDGAERAVPDLPTLHYNRANLLQELMRGGEAVESYRRAIAANPLDMPAHSDLNALLYRLGRDEEFLRSYDEAAALYPDMPMLFTDKASMLLHAGELEKAAEAFRAAIPLKPDDVMPRDGLALALGKLGQFEDAIAEHETVLRMEPENGPAWRNFAYTLLRAGDPERAAKAAEEALARNPVEQGALTFWGTALRALGDPREEALNDYETLVQRFELAPPPGYADIESFNRELAQVLTAMHTDARGFVNQTLRDGTQTLGNLFLRREAMVQALKTEIDNAVGEYVARMKDDASHPVYRRRTREFRYSGSWSTKLNDCGYHTNHFHPEGWISSAYYVAVPDAVGDANEKAGWLKFGEPDFAAPYRDPVRRAVQPRPGTLVLFPSYMWHGTNPFRAEAPRMAVAFDVVPR